MTHDQRLVREQQLRTLLAAGERGPVLQQLFGVSARTIKRWVRQTTMAVRTGRTHAPRRGWLGRDRHVVEQVLQQWLHVGLDKLLAGEALGSGQVFLTVWESDCHKVSQAKHPQRGGGHTDDNRSGRI